jgi:hypothetical protein
LVRFDALWPREQGEGIEVPVMTLPGQGAFIRIWAHVYNQLADYERLADSLPARGIRGRSCAS